MVHRLIVLLFLLSSNLLGQTFYKAPIGSSSTLLVQAGLSFDIGGHSQRAGFNLKASYSYDFIQLNTSFWGFYNFKSFPVGLRSIEGQLKLGILGAWGPKHYDATPFMHINSNQTQRPYAFGYSYHIYIEKNTRQHSGSIGFNAYQFSLLMENDFLAFRLQDKFRTGSLGIYYNSPRWQIGIKQLAWTGNPYYAGAIWYDDDKTFPSPYGYMNMNQAKYGNISTGILAAEVRYMLPYGQVVGAAIGWDSEQIRNIAQNKLIHDSFFLKNPHIPMVDKKGKSYLYREGQQVRAARTFWQVTGNAPIFY